MENMAPLAAVLPSEEIGLWSLICHMSISYRLMTNVSEEQDDF